MQYTPTVEGDKIVQADIDKILKAVKGERFEINFDKGKEIV